MKILVADTGALISLIHINQLILLDKLFGGFYLPFAVWVELNNYDNPLFDRTQLYDLHSRILQVDSKTQAVPLMDYGESESMILYKQLGADFLLIDDQRAREIAESLNINCIGTLGILIKAKKEGLLSALKPLFQQLVSVGRYYSKSILNQALVLAGEEPME